MHDDFAAALGDRYRIDREIGRGGNAVVYLALDLKHDRPVALKVLLPELSQSVSKDRFLREIRIAARLSHLHILPLHDSGEAAGALYYVMPYVQGESLRARLLRERQLPLEDALRITREVASALSYAHSEGVVHRDIKPENVLLQGDEAVVADFGIARALSEAMSAGVTQAGIAVGTPDYMSPEQASGNMELDGRSDQYALGCVLYEMLAGHPPFSGRSPQEILARHALDPVPRLAAARPGVPDAVERAVRKALEKTPVDRFATTTAFAAALSAQQTAPLSVEVTAEPAGGAPSPPVVAPRSPFHEWHSRSVWQVLGAYLLAAGIGYLVIRGLYDALGLPDWVPPVAIVLFIVGLPIVLATQRGLGSFLTWRRSLLAGVAAFALLAVITASFMAMRSYGVGPVGTLFGKGVLDEKDRFVLADFTSSEADARLGEVVTEALRIDLLQSKAIRLVDPRELVDALVRMKRNPADGLSEPVAREVAVREGIKAILAGEVGPVGRGYILSARLISPQDGAVMAAFRETARDSAQLVDAIERLSREMRSRIGESLRTIRTSEPLGKVSSASIPALRKYTEARKELQRTGNQSRLIALLEEAVEIDTSFADAWRLLSGQYNNVGGHRDRMVLASTRAYQYRDRLPEKERYLAIAQHADFVEGNRARAMEAYRSVLAVDPNDWISLGNLANHLRATRQYTEAEVLLKRALENGGSVIQRTNLAYLQFQQGKRAEAYATVRHALDTLPGNAVIERALVTLLAADGRWEDADTSARAYLRRQPPSSTGLRTMHRMVANLETIRGHLAGARRHSREVDRIAEQEGAPSIRFTERLNIASALVDVVGDTAGALRALDMTLAEMPLAAMPRFERPYLDVAYLELAAGAAAQAERTLNEYERTVRKGERGSVAEEQLAIARDLLAFERAPSLERLEELKSWEQRYICDACILAFVAPRYERLGQRDSAIVTYERYLRAPVAFTISRNIDPARVRARTLERLAQLYDERGDMDRAALNYAAFVKLWSSADPELRPRVMAAQRRLEAITRKRG